MEELFGTKKLGFGCMRLPLTGPAADPTSQVDFEKTCRMVDDFMAAGFCYFDTAHGYLNGKSETALRQCLTSRYPRERYLLADKLSNSFFNSEEEIRPLFFSQLEACGVEYFDFYLMHAMNANYYPKGCACNAFAVARQLKEEGYIRHIGISFHDKPALLEQILTDLHTGDPQWNVMLLRYFNPIGAHPSGLIGEDPKGIPNNLVPYIAQVAVGKLKCLGVFGNDYDTPDGTGVRDYIHVVDLACGHVKALEKLKSSQGVFIYNLGTGKGYSVLDVVKAYGKACGKEIPYEIKPRRPGDIATCYADPSKAEKELGWKAQFGIEEMCADSWHWQSMNPDGYRTGNLGQ